MAVIQVGRPGQHLPRKRVTGTSAALSIGGASVQGLNANQRTGRALSGSLKRKASKDIAMAFRSAFYLGAVVSMPLVEMTAAARIEAARRRLTMIAGKGILILRDGRRIALGYEFAAVYDDLRVGFLRCDTSGVDPSAFFDRLKMECEDGTTILLAVMHHSDRYLGITGRVMPSHEIEREGPLRAATRA
jgi:hypothetical protein